MAALGIAAVAIGSMAGSASAQSLLEKIRNGDAIRLGFTNEPPGAYPGENNEPLGLVNAMTLDILKRMGTTKVEAVVTEWGSLIPGLQAGRFDIITGGMYIKPERCRNVLFSEPIATAKDALIVPKGNPEGLHSYEDVRDKGLTLATGAGYTAVKVAQDLGIADDKIMQVAGPPEIVQAVKAGRAAAGGFDYMIATRFVGKDQSVELADPYTSPVSSDYPAIAFPLTDQAAVDAFNAVLKDYLGSDEMMASVGEYGYGKGNLPDGTTTAEACNR
ncbi:ectoine/hydroxyectoine ABC transporter substrate-binding protein EhuB [Mesorhizobium sp.]|uniref:ectoine/hydroxyectoine ABC transporter substrate-binding protein EhuB n=1 Tax=Mesorhizobium sp. TaxID=1871066 RepID=UPI000FE3065D|nr:ectoine/hydroxyectoine ABC transporter substrate-binding protein EhuB [Mesorhizobium sp.]RWQ13515.1 MAG: ectoine/hydroxyectoine ABC transporter substrate-binding protein EhuB [Mesorhizobium sp.]